MDGLKNHSAFRGLPPFRPFSREDAALRSDFTRPMEAAAEEMWLIPSFWEMVSVADHQYPPTSSRKVGDVSPGRRSNRNALDPSFQYAVRCESFLPPSQNFNASFRFLAIICCMASLLSHDLRGLIAQAICALILFQLISICDHSPDSQFSCQPFQFVSFFKIHFVILLLFYFSIIYNIIPIVRFVKKIMNKKVLNVRFLYNQLTYNELN